MSQRTGIPANLIAKAMKMARDGVSHAHIAAWARCPVATIDSLVKKDLSPKAAAKAEPETVAVLVPKEPEVNEAELVEPEDEVEPETTDEPSDVPDEPKAKEEEPTEENTAPDK